ncbi:MAG: protein translocase subunit SecF [Pyrinomonadaceae bacterium]|nr:protein translocase subunit SecF [Pyrinomonadaceae bacterium]
MIEIFDKVNIDWMGKRRVFIAISTTLMLAGLASTIIRVSMGQEPFNLGVDFKGGSVITPKFKAETRPGDDEIRAALQKAGVKDAVLQPSIDKKDEVQIKLPLYQNTDDADAQKNQVNIGRAQVKQALDDAFGKEAVGNLADEPDAVYKIVGTEAVGPVAGKQLRTQAVAVTLLGLVGILLFIAFRYDWTYGAGAVIAVFHDVLVTIGFFSIFYWEINLTVIAALLTLVGFSVNDSIVIFDRIRENTRENRRSSLYQITNDSINQTLSRTVITAGLVLLSVIALVLFGGEVLFGFSIALLIGIINGTYSTFAIAAPIAIWWENLLGSDRDRQMKQPQQTVTLASSARKSVTRQKRDNDIQAAKL